jgi:hypothetical protein
MIQKRNISTFAIGLCLLAFMLLTASPAKAHDHKFKRWHSPGETVGPESRSAIACGSSCSIDKCEAKLVCARGNPPVLKNGRQYQWTDNPYCTGWIEKVVSVGFTRYIQFTGGYCYYYNGGISSGASGPNTWRYDPK